MMTKGSHVDHKASMFGAILGIRIKGGRHSEGDFLAHLIHVHELRVSSFLKFAVANYHQLLVRSNRNISQFWNQITSQAILPSRFSGSCSSWLFQLEAAHGSPWLKAESVQHRASWAHCCRLCVLSQISCCLSVGKTLLTTWKAHSGNPVRTPPLEFPALPAS